MFDKITVIGAGTMGHGIAEIAALNGYDVFLCDISNEILQEAVKKIEWSLRKMVEKGKLDGAGLTLTLNRLKTTTSLAEAVKDSKLIIEAIPENLELKKEIFSKLDKIAHPESILGTNTSSLPISEIAAVTSRPDKVIGIHFFNPPVLMPLVEIVSSDRTSRQTVESVLAFVKTLGKHAILCKKDVPGFVVNRVLEALIQEAAWIVYRGEASILEIDSATKYKAKLPMGLFELSDYVGIDVLYSAGKAIQDRDKGVIVSPLFEEYYKNGWYGKKSGKGFYNYAEGLWEKPKIPSELADKVRLEEIFAPAVNAAAWLLRNDVVDKEELDKAVVLGLNFPEGILQMADKWGIDVLVQVLKTKQSKYGEYYAPNPLLEEMVASNRLGVKTRRGFYEYACDCKILEEIRIILEPPLAWIVLNRPEKLNALSLKMLDELSSVLEELSTDRDVRVVLIKGSPDGKSFCVGVDISTFVNLKPLDALRVSKRLQEVVNKLETFPKPVVAVIDGYALGGGFELALGCDFRIASNRAELGLPEIRLGLIPGGGGTQRLPKIIGEAKAKELIMLGERLKSEEALRIGLVNYVVQPERLDEEVRKFAQKLAEAPPIAIMTAKNVIRLTRHGFLEEGLAFEASSFASLFMTKDAVEGISAFLNKRKTNFIGE